MAEANSGGTSGMPRPERYTITPRALDLYREFSLFRLNMDTWYYSEWADPNHRATLSRVALG